MKKHNEYTLRYTNKFGDNITRSVFASSVQEATELWQKSLYSEEAKLISCEIFRIYQELNDQSVVEFCRKWQEETMCKEQFGQEFKFLGWNFKEFQALAKKNNVWDDSLEGFNIRYQIENIRVNPRTGNIHASLYEYGPAGKILCIGATLDYINENISRYFK